MLRRFIPAAVAAISLAGLAFTSPASAASLPDRMYGCARGDICMYSTAVPSEATKIGIGRGEDWESSMSSPSYRPVRSVFNYGFPEYEDHVALGTHTIGDQFTGTVCIHRAEDGNPAAGIRAWSYAQEVFKIDWINASKYPCNE
ncbi:hypothetical protein ACQP1V_27380 [Microtetraspora malaysiensis]|uniref:hypothetical protein n=1 Tax=Microtetraspora malaysiensis TaxID=161358 RepID=UPI003D91FFDF